MNGSSDSPHLLFRFGLSVHQHLGDAEIDEFDLLLLSIVENIVRLEISVTYAFGVDQLHSLK